MSGDVRLQALTQDDWAEESTHFCDINYKQLWGYNLLAAEKIGAFNEFWGIYRGEKLIGLCNVRVKKIAALPLGIAYVNAGPVFVRCGTKPDLQVYSDCITGLRAEYCEKRDYLLRIKCNLYPEIAKHLLDQKMTKLGFYPMVDSEQYRTMLVDLAPSLEEIRKNFIGKWRNQLNAAERNELEVTVSENPMSFDRFEELFSYLRQKKNFTVDQDSFFFKSVQQKLYEHEKLKIISVSKDGELLAMHIGSYIGDSAVYILGATTPEGNKLKASYVLQWKAIQIAKQAGCKFYDLGGIDPDKNKGVFHFKKGLGGSDETAAGPYEYSTYLVGVLVRLAEQAYRLLKTRKAGK